MAGANYMGGRRNAARARSKDVSGRTQKGHFMKQRHQILVSGLQDNFHNDKETRAAQAGSIEEIHFAHAKRDLQAGHGRVRTRAAMESVLRSSSSPKSISRRKRSKLLQALDINDPFVLRTTMSRLLRLPDLAGLSKVNAWPVSRKSDQNLQQINQSPRKKQKTSRQNSDMDTPPLLSYSRSPAYRGNSSRPLLSSKSQHAHRATDADTSGPHYNHSAQNSNDPSDCFSNMQEPGTDYLNSGFSELEFVDELEAEDASSLGSKMWSGNASSLSSSTSSPHCIDDARKFVPKAPGIPKPLSLHTSDTQQPHSKVSQECRQSPFMNLKLPSSPQFKQISLLNFSDPWLALDDILGLRPSAKYKENAGRDPFKGINADDRSGVGYKAPEALAPALSLVSSCKTLESSGGMGSLSRSLSENISSGLKEEDNSIAEGSVSSSSRSSSPHSTHPGFSLTRHPSQVNLTTPQRISPPPASTTRLGARPRFSLNVYDTVSGILDENVDDPIITPKKNTSKPTLCFTSPLICTKSRTAIDSPPPTGSRRTPMNGILHTRLSIGPDVSSFAGHPAFDNRRSEISNLREPTVSSTVYQMLFPARPSNGCRERIPRQNAPLIPSAFENSTQSPLEFVTIDGPDLFGEYDEDGE